MKKILTIALLTPALVFGAPQDFKSLVVLLLGIIEALVTFVVALTFIVFIWGIVSAWILNPADQQKIEAGRNTALAGIIGMIVAISIWGIVKLLKSGLF